MLRLLTPFTMRDLADTWMLYEQENWITVSPAVLNDIAKNPLTSRVGFDYSSIVSGMTLLDTVVNEGHVRTTVRGRGWVLWSGSRFNIPRCDCGPGNPVDCILLQQLHCVPRGACCTAPRLPAVLQSRVCQLPQLDVIDVCTHVTVALPALTPVAWVRLTSW